MPVLKYWDGAAWVPLAAPDITAAQSSYWHGLGATPTTPQGNDVQVTVGWTTTRTTGFTLASSGQRITPSQAGKYHVVAVLDWYTGTNGAAYSRCQIRHFNAAGTELTNVNAIGNGIPAGNYGQATADAVFDMAVGDYITVTGAIASTTGYLVAVQSYCSVTPVGGVKGDSGGPVPTGGTYGQVIEKTSAADMAVAWGNTGRYVTGATGSLNGIGTSTTDITGAAVTFTSPGNRRYLIFAEASCIQNVAAATPQFFVRNAANTVITFGWASWVNVGYFNAIVMATDVPPAGPVTYKCSAFTSANTMNVPGAGIFVFDAGAA